MVCNLHTIFQGVAPSDPGIPTKLIPNDATYISQQSLAILVGVDGNGSLLRCVNLSPSNFTRASKKPKCAASNCAVFRTPLLAAGMVRNCW